MKTFDELRKTLKEHTAAYERGYKAYYDGKNVDDDNPYKLMPSPKDRDIENYNDWLDGFLTAEYHDKAFLDDEENKDV